VICLTGDLHHNSLGTGNQKHCDITELQTTQLFLKILEGADIPVTFFVSGRCFTEEWKDIEPIVNHRLVEFGGHNFSCFQPEIVHRVFNKVLKSYNGPPVMQYVDARLTIAAARARTGKTINLWRNHMYMHGPWTEEVLQRAGIICVSDGVQKNSPGPQLHKTGIYNFPINVIPDHEHIYHAERTPEWVANWQKRYNWSDDFGPQSYQIEEWTDLVIAGLQENEEKGVISNMIIHPITMYLADRFKGFSRIAAYLKTRECLHMSQVLPGKNT
jgi:hypothetical protein